jgi:PPP family 3-phenylpropionic acid transporter
MTAYGQLALFYFCYFGALGALVPFLGAYLTLRGMDATVIGSALAILMGTKMIAPLLWGWLADRDQQRMIWVRRAALFNLLAFIPIYWADQAWMMIAVFILFSFFWNAPLPLIEAVTLNHLGVHANQYAKVRVWGSLGFILVVSCLGVLINQVGATRLPDVVMVFFCGVWLSSLFIPDQPYVAKQSTESTVALTSVLAHSSVRFFLFSCLMMQLSHGAYYAFYSLHLTSFGYSSSTIGALWAFGVVVEIVIFMRMHVLLERFGAKRILIGCLAIAVGRWGLVAWFGGSLVIQIIAQACHALTFGAFHAAAIYTVHHVFPGSTQGRGQALYNAISFGVGGALGAGLSGLLWTYLGAQSTFLMSAVATLIGLMASRLMIEPQDNLVLSATAPKINKIDTFE